MKTTIDIPDALYKKAKIHAVESGRTLKDLVLSSLERELDAPPVVKEKSHNYWTSRKLLPEFKKMYERGAFSGGTDSTQIISEDRDAR